MADWRIVNRTTNKIVLEYEGPVTLPGSHSYIMYVGVDGGGAGFLALPELLTQLKALPA